MSNPAANRDYLFHLSNQTGTSVQLATIVTSIDKLVLTQDTALPTGEAAYQVVRDQDLCIYASHIVIRGPILIPGRSIRIFARFLSTEKDSNGNTATIDVSGTEGANPSPPLVAPKQARSGASERGKRKPGPDGSSGTPGQPGQPGSAGRPGGSIDIHTEHVSRDARLSLRAMGGPGGAGQTGQAGGHGGNGGEGDWTLKDGPFGPELEDLPGGNGGQGGTGGRGGGGGEGGPGGSITIEAYLDGCVTTVDSSAKGGAGGAGGHGGAGGPGGAGGAGGHGTTFGVNGFAGRKGQDGPHGPEGKDGSAQQVSLDLSSANAYERLARWIRPELATMLLRKARVYYLTADPDENRDGFKSAADALGYLTRITYLFENSPPAGPTAEGLTPEDIAQLARIHRQSCALAHQICLGIDAFGHQFDWVPRVSFQTDTSQFEKVLTLYKDVESAFDQYFANLENQAAAQIQIGASISHANETLTHLTQVQESLADEATQLVAKIDRAEAAVNDQRAVVQRDIAGLEAEIESAVGCPVRDVFSSLQMLAFAPAAGRLGGIGIIAGAAGSVLSSQFENAPIGPGGQVNRKYLVHLIGEYGANVTSIQEGVRQSGEYITSDDPNGYKLAIAVQQFESVLSQYSQLSLVPKTVDDLNQYLAEVQTMNSFIIQYNAALSSYAKTTARIEQTKFQLAQAQATWDQKLDPTTPTMATYMGDLYATARNACLELVYTTSRAYSFWALQEYPGLYRLLGRNEPSLITADMLAAADAQIVQDTNAAMEAFGRDMQRFPAGEAHGLTFVISGADELDKLRSAHELRFSIPAAVPGGSGDIFTGMANVRITVARPWLSGARTAGGTLKLELTQMGLETIVTPNGTAHSYTHAPVTAIFSYDTRKPQTDPTAIQIDSVFGRLSSDDFAPIGPFARWLLRIDPHDPVNAGLDLSGVSALQLEFHGGALPFAANAQRIAVPGLPVAMSKSRKAYASIDAGSDRTEGTVGSS